jgi:PBP1b-binding outer membrane lipoprotein LpoB
MKTSISIFVMLAFLAFFFSGCAVGVSGHGYIRDESPAFSVNESHGLDWYQMYGY